MEAVIGTNDPVAKYQEFGRRAIPPRSFLAASVIHKEKEIAEIVGEGFVGGLTGEAVSRPIAVSGPPSGS